MSEQDQKEFAFERTVCECRKCKIWCEHMPGYLVPSDLARLIPVDADPMVWAEQHLRASQGYIGFTSAGLVSIPSLVPAKKEDGHCHWYEGGRCGVHDRSPFGCAYIDQDMTTREAERRNDAGREARRQAFDQQSLYSRIWGHLWDKGLIYASSTEDRLKALTAIGLVVRREEGKQRRKARKSLKKMKARSRR